MRFALVCWGSRGIEGRKIGGVIGRESFFLSGFFSVDIPLGFCASSVFYVMFQDAFTARWV